MENIEITTKDDSNIVKIKGTFTSGKIYAIIHALEASDSPVANDVKYFLLNAIYRDNQKNPKSVFGSRVS